MALEKNIDPELNSIWKSKNSYNTVTINLITQQHITVEKTNGAIKKIFTYSKNKFHELYRRVGQ